MTNFRHQCTGCAYCVVLTEDDSRHSVCPKCNSRFKVTPTDEPAIQEQPR